MEKFLTKKQAAEVLQVSVRTIDHLRTNCNLPSIQLDRAVRIPENGLQEWIKSHISDGMKSMKQVVEA